jgi:hypothetical protein
MRMCETHTLIRTFEGGPLLLCTGPLLEEAWKNGRTSTMGTREYGDV